MHARQPLVRSKQRLVYSATIGRRGGGGDGGSGASTFQSSLASGLDLASVTIVCLELSLFCSTQSLRSSPVFLFLSFLGNRSCSVFKSVNKEVSFFGVINTILRTKVNKSPILGFGCLRFPKIGKKSLILYSLYGALMYILFDMLLIMFIESFDGFRIA